ncbi:hypothetical protein MYSTI_03163 [Myxococcus stipitatus DSM 14675]|uniref:Uncharacterized protein n=1 Tax=Myxococcus stipitatus (strain DSM 14675 / JCM 12634 / Mx s8) TaxID=1278073 RepID=L7UA83_MYXSD|nr:hypothetical protein [Myxococcus stipitatus]AGC44477.1 hypothetical protein MYSTI_03163 [Myxococcus stipitatus DSM 14675]
MAFQERLALSLSLATGGRTFTIPGGQVESFAFRLLPHGFTASVSFWTGLEKDDAPLFTAFAQPDLLDVKLSLSGGYPIPEPPPKPLVLHGLARSRALEARTHGTLDGAPVRFRRYTVEFEDAAQVLWRQHRPTELRTEATLADLLTEHSAGAFKLDCDWDVLDEKRPLICLALGEDAPGVSFHDFVAWLVESRGGVWTYDFVKDRYALLGRKAPLGKAAPLSWEKVAQVEVVVPALPRHAARVLNASALQPSTLELPATVAVAGVQQDHLVRTPIVSQVEQRQTLEGSRVRVPQRRLRLSFRHYPTVAVSPGVGIRLEGKRWGTAAVGTGEDLRSVELSMSARTLNDGPHVGLQMQDAGFEVDMSLLLERAADTTVTLPAHRVPRYPIHVEGKVLSPGGGEKDRIYLLSEDKKTSVLTWRVTVPLWNKVVSVPAEPGFFPGHFYFPPYKNARVMVELHFDRAELHRHLDWADAARLPQAGQGDGLLLGKNDTSQTSITHDYQDAKPVWHLRRVSGADTETVRMAEGVMMLRTKEEPGASSAAPTFDVSPQVETARADLSSGVGGAMGETTAAYRVASGASQAKLDGATSETQAALEAAQAKVSAKVSETRSELKGALSGLEGKTSSLTSAAAEARVALEALK